MAQVVFRRTYRLAAVALALSSAAARAEQHCPPESQTLTQLMLVDVVDISGRSAAVRLFERSTPRDDWRQGRKMKAVIGRNGMGWSAMHRDRIITSAPIKREGDGRTPGGIFPIGRAFGFESSVVPGYLRLRAGYEFCVSDTNSPDYNQILDRTPKKAVDGEDMGAIDLYRRGLFIEYPSNAGQRAGSCIFVHVWRSSNGATAGCVALAQSDVEFLQSWARPGQASIAILPSIEAQALVGCLKGLSSNAR